MVEVHSASRPGRPALLIILSGLALIGSLGFAWLQSNEKRALGPAQRIAGTPLSVRVPRGWHQTPGEPGRFILADKHDPHGTQGALDRQVAFHYDRQIAYAPPERVIQTWNRLQRAQSEEPIRTNIRGIPAIQVIRHHQQRAFGITFQKESILRVAAHPRGDIVAVEYWTVRDLSGADLELMDAICAAIEFVDAELRRVGDDAKRHAGLAFSTVSGWSIVGPRHDSAPALHVLSDFADGTTGAVAVARTWISPGRTPEALLRDHFAADRPDAASRARVLEWGRRDGLIVHGIQLPDPKYPQSQAFWAYSLSTARGDAALVLPLPGGDFAAGMALAAKLADVVSFADGSPLPDHAEAAREGVAIAAKIHEKGAVSWWGRSPERREYLFEGRGSVALAHATDWRPASGTAADGYSYRGAELTLDTAGRRFIRSRWLLGAGAADYELTIEVGREDPLLPGTRGLLDEWAIREKLENEPPRIHREVRRGTDSIATRSLSPGPSFVAPPVETIAEELVAFGSAAAALIEVSHPLGSGLCQRLLRRLEPDSAGRARLLRVDDYDPLGVVLTFDADRAAADRVIDGIVIPRIEPTDRPPRVVARMRELLEKER